MTIRAVVGLGSNVGDRLGYLQSAAQRIAKIGHVERASHVYETAAVGGPEQAAFLNAALLVAYEGEPVDLLDALQAIETILGRTRGSSGGGRGRSTSTSCGSKEWRWRAIA